MMAGFFDNLNLNRKLSILVVFLLFPLIILVGFSVLISVEKITLLRQEIIGLDYAARAIPVWIEGEDQKIQKLLQGRVELTDKLGVKNNIYYIPDTLTAENIKRMRIVNQFVSDMDDIANYTGMNRGYNYVISSAHSLLMELIPQYYVKISLQALNSTARGGVNTYETKQLAVKIDKTFQILLDASTNQAQADLISRLRGKISDDAETIYAEIVAAPGEDFYKSPAYQKFSQDIAKDLSQLTVFVYHQLTSEMFWQWVLVFVEFGSVLFLILIAIALMRQISRSVVSPMNDVIEVIDQLSFGKLPDHMPRYDRQDEVGQLTHATHRFYNLLLDRQGAADSTKMEAEKQGRQSEISKLYQQFNNKLGEILSGFSGASEELSATAYNMSETAQKASSRVGTLAAASEEVNVNINLVSDSSDNLVRSLENISQKVETSQDITRAAVKEANNSIDLINDLSETAKKIGTIVDLINSIAAQTNLLALNATIEAARAGEAGRGFAVVAGEVKTLASQTARATDDIANQIKAIQSVTDNVVHTIQNIAATIQKIDNVAADIWELVRHERLATKDIAYSVEQASAKTHEVSSSVSELGHAVEQTSVAASQVLSSADALGERASFLQNNVEEFLHAIARLIQESNQAIDALLSNQFTASQKTAISS